MKDMVLITGATSGIGYELAKIFSDKEYNLILVGRNIDRLNSLKKELKQNNIVEIFPCDFNNLEEIEHLYNFICNNKFNIDILINNAGLGYNGYFHEIDWYKHKEVINVNITSLTYLTRLIVKDMKNRNKGKILNVASTGAYQPGPLINVYYATKAYVLSFSQGLREELKEFGINVTALCPGATKTNFSKRSGKGDLKVAMSAKDVALIGFNGLMKNKDIVVPGPMNKFLVLGSILLPSSINSKLVKKIQEKAIYNR